MVVHNKFWDTLQVLGSDESDKMATKRPSNRQRGSGRETSKEKTSQELDENILTV